MALQIDIDAVCDLGRVRNNNEDMILVGDTTLRNRAASRSFALDDSHGRLLLAVADGVGGHQAGEVASETALVSVRDLMAGLPDDLCAEELAEVFTTWARETHARLMHEAAIDPARAGMGTTVVGLLIYNGAAYRFHAGDSRLYRLRDGHLERLTRDHSAREDSGDPQQPSNVITNSLGAADPSWLEFSLLQGGLASWDRYLLSSDGLHDLVADATLETLLSGERGFAARTLVNLANQTSGKDNISVLLADLRESSPA